MEQIITNNVPRDVTEAFELTEAERAEFDYLDWPAIERGEDGATFVRYRGDLMDLGEFETTKRLPEASPLRGWDGVRPDSFFSAVVVRYVDDFERIVVGLYLS